MSGIVGLWNLDGRPAEPDLLARLSAPLAHRGPDGESRWLRGPAGLACWLSRVTPEASTETQPLVHSSGAVLVFDGRLDNREELLGLLRSSPEVAADAPDPVLVMAAYAHCPEKFAELLNGDFALGLFDPVRRQLLLVRDALGIRPLYYCRAGDTFLFASEIKALLAHPKVSAQPDDDQLADFLVGGTAQDSRGFTFFRGVTSLLPAHVARVSPEGVVVRRYWDFDVSRRTRFHSFEECAAAFRHHYEQAVRRRLRSAHPVAIGVSGGLDSSSNFCLAQTLAARGESRAPIFGISYTSAEGSPADEQRYLLEIERAYGVDVRRVPIRTAGPLKGARQEVWHVEAPLLDTLWDNTHTFQETARDMGARVLLTGQFADNVLFNQAYLVDLFRRLKWGTVWTHLRELPRWYRDAEPRIFRNRFFRQVARHHVPAALVPLLRRIREGLSRAGRRPPWYATLLSQRAGRPTPPPSRSNGRGATAHAQALYQAVRSRTSVLSMEWNNKVGALHGLEIAFPFLDRDLVSFLMGIPGEMASWKGAYKSILRAAMRGVLPEAIAERRWKADFTDLVNRGVASDYPQLVQLIDAGTARRRGYLDERVLNDELARVERPIAGTDCSVAWGLSDLVGLELWLRIFFEGESSCTNTRAQATAVGGTR